MTNPAFVDLDGNGFLPNKDTLGHPLPVKFRVPPELMVSVFPLLTLKRSLPVPYVVDVTAMVWPLMVALSVPSTPPPPVFQPPTSGFPFGVQVAGVAQSPVPLEI